VAKRRTSATTVQATSLVGEVEGRDIILVDDMTETAGTLTAAAELLKKNGARSVRAMVSHCMIQEIAYERFRSGVIDEVITTNSVPIETRGLPITVLSIAPLLADAIRRIHGNNSVTDLFPIKGH
jgi:ribose-phosphate pyrophosphokinase